MLVLKVQEDGRTTLTLPIDWEGRRTLGRSAPEQDKHFQIGKDLGDAGDTISRIHATLRSERLGDNYVVQIHDGTEHKASASGLWYRNSKITGWFTLTPGVEVELLRGYIVTVLQDRATDPGSDRTVSQEEALAEQVERLETVVDGIGSPTAADCRGGANFSCSRTGCSSSKHASHLDSQKEETDRQQQESIRQQREALAAQNAQLAAQSVQILSQSSQLAATQKRVGKAMQIGLGGFIVALIAPVLIPNADPKLREAIENNTGTIGAIFGGAALWSSSTLKKTRKIKPLLKEDIHAVNQ
jgi:hypothetical protein